MDLVVRSMKDVTAELCEGERLIAMICADDNNFLTGEVKRSQIETLVDDDAIEEIKETITKIKALPGGIAEFVAGEGWIVTQ